MRVYVSAAAIDREAAIILRADLALRGHLVASVLGGADRMIVLTPGEAGVHFAMGAAILKGIPILLCFTAGNVSVGDWCSSDLTSRIIDAVVEMSASAKIVTWLQA